MMTFSQSDLNDLPCAVILTAITEEYRAVSSFLTSITRVKHPHGTVYRQGVFSEGSHAWKVIVCEIGPGNTGAAVEGERAIAHFKPRVLAFVGVAGGLKDVNIGDVVAATKVYGYHAGKAKEAFQTRPDVFLSSYELVQEARDAKNQNKWIARSRFQSDETPKALVAPIAAGEEVVASTYSEAWQLIRRSYGDAVAVEMEGAGLLKAGHANQHVNAIVVRGISDLVDGKEAADASGSQEIAADRASAFMFEILSNMNLDADATIQNIPAVIQRNTPNAAQAPQRNYQTVNEAELLKRAQALASPDRDAYPTGLSLIVVGGPTQQIIRPSELDGPDLLRTVKQEAVYGAVPVFKDSQGTTDRTVGRSLLVEQPDAAISLDEQGAVRITMPGRSDNRGRRDLLGVIIEEEVVERLTTELRYATWLLDHVDAQKRLTDVVVLVVFSGAGYFGWRTRAEHQASPNQVSMSARTMTHGDKPVIVQLSPALRKRESLTLETQTIVEDLVTLLRREMK